jgi:hypothetical protein
MYSFFVQQKSNLIEEWRYITAQKQSSRGYDVLTTDILELTSTKRGEGLKNPPFLLCPTAEPWTTKVPVQDRGLRAEAGLVQKLLPRPCNAQYT